MSTLTKNTTVSKVWKYKLMGCPIIHPRMTKNGVTSKAICILLPIATPMARSIYTRQHRLAYAYLLWSGGAYQALAILLMLYLTGARGVAWGRDHTTRRQQPSAAETQKKWRGARVGYMIVWKDRKKVPEGAGKVNDKWGKGKSKCGNFCHSNGVIVKMSHEPCFS